MASGPKFEDVLDQALQSLLDGEPLESVLARYPNWAGDLRPLLSSAGAFKRGPHPAMPASTLATIAQRAQEQAAKDRGTAQAPTAAAPAGWIAALQGSTSGNRSALNLNGRTASQPERRGWWGKLSGWLQPDRPAVRVATFAAVILLMVFGAITLSRLVARPTVYPPVPQNDVRQFAFEGQIKTISAESWQIGNLTIYLAKDTQIVGTPAVGLSAEVEGKISSDGRRIASLITVLPPATVVALPSAPPVVVPGISPTAPPQPVEVAATPSLPVAAGNFTPTTTAAQPAATRVHYPVATPTAARAGGGVASPTRARGGSGGVVQPTHTPIIVRSEPTHTSVPSPTWTMQPPHTPTATRQPQPTFTPAYTPTVTQAPATPSPVLTNSPVPTAEPTGQPEETPSSEPTDTAPPRNTPTQMPTAQPSPTAQPTETPEPEDTPTVRPTNTVRPTATRARTATPLPTAQPSASPTGESHETETVVPTQSVSPTQTGEAQPTSQP